MLKFIKHPIHSCSLSQPKDLKNEGKFLMKLTAGGKNYELEIVVDFFIELLVREMNKNLERFDKNRPAYTEAEVRPLFKKYFLCNQKVDLNSPLFQAISSSLTNIVLSGHLLSINDDSLVRQRRKDKFKLKAPLAEDIDKGKDKG